MASKLQAYRCQTEPFVHIDLDAYLWAPLPARLTGAPVIAQSSEEDWGYYDEVVSFFLRSVGYLPDFIRQHTATCGFKVRALNAGIYGGHDLTAIHACCDAAFTTMEHPANQALFNGLCNSGSRGYELRYGFNVLLEQYFAGVYCHQHDVPIGYVLSNQEPPYFTHLLAGAKRLPDNVTKLKARVARDYPSFYLLAQQATQ